jgi:phosphoserine phosphatase
MTSAVPMQSASRESPGLQAVVFDMDGVIFEGDNFWLDLHREYGTEQQALQLAERYLSTDYGLLARITAQELWRSRAAAPYLRLVAERHYQPGVKDLFARLQEAGIRTVLVSSGSDLLAARAQKDLGIDAVAANGLGVRDGKLSGELFLRVSDTAKASAAMELLSLVGVTPQRAAAVGDSRSDVGVARIVALPVAYNSRSPELLSVASCALQYGDLPKLAEIMNSYEPGRPLHQRDPE